MTHCRRSTHLHPLHRRATPHPAIVSMSWAIQHHQYSMHSLSRNWSTILLHFITPPPHSAQPCRLPSTQSGMKKTPRPWLLMDANRQGFQLPPFRRTTLQQLCSLHSITSLHHQLVQSPSAPHRQPPRPPTLRTCSKTTYTTIVRINFISSNGVCRTRPSRFTSLPFILCRSIITRHLLDTRIVASRMLH